MNKKAELEQKLGKVALMALYGMLSTICYLLVALAIMKVFAFALDLPDLRMNNKITAVMYLEYMMYLAFACVVWVLPSQIYNKYMRPDEMSE